MLIPAFARWDTMTFTVGAACAWLLEAVPISHGQPVLPYVPSIQAMLRPYGGVAALRRQSLFIAAMM